MGIAYDGAATFTQNWRVNNRVSTRFEAVGPVMSLLPSLVASDNGNPVLDINLIIAPAVESEEQWHLHAILTLLGQYL